MLFIIVIVTTCSTPFWSKFLGYYFGNFLLYYLLFAFIAAILAVFFANYNFLSSLDTTTGMCVWLILSAVITFKILAKK
jgi:hypothetical protein